MRSYAFQDTEERLKKENLKSKLILQVHDELIIEANKNCVDKAKEILKREMENAVKLNEIGLELQKEQGPKWLLSDFKKKNGYKRSIELSNEYGLYRQDYCGCEFSKREMVEKCK